MQFFSCFSDLISYCSCLPHSAPATLAFPWCVEQTQLMCTLRLLHMVLPLPGALCPRSPHDWILLTVQSWIQIAPPSRSPPWSSYHACPSSCLTASPALAYHPQFSRSSPSSWSEVNLLECLSVTCLPSRTWAPAGWSPYLSFSWLYSQCPE